MRAAKYAFLLFGLLALYAASFPLTPRETGLARRIDGDVVARDFDLAIEDEHELEKRRGRGGSGRSRARPSRVKSNRKTRKPKKKAKQRKLKAKRPKAKQPAKKRPATKKRPTTKKRPATTKPHTKKPATKKPKACKRNAHGTQSCPLKKKKQCKRTGTGSHQDCGKTENYKVAEAAARKKGKTLQLNQAYMLKFETDRSIKRHAKLIVGTVRKNKQGELDFVASASELAFADYHNLQGCEHNFGAKCAHRPTKQYSCQEDMSRWELGQYKFKGMASPEFADPEHFFAEGKKILEKNTKYNIIYNNCQWHARKVKNVAKLKKGENPTVPEQPDSESESESESESRPGTPQPPARGPLRVINGEDSDSD